ncbi:BREX-2 system adenine-specific DNA-methyltransferase PglX [Streptomyces tsukubensis]|uniref:site-specific DNA-methyltransferase (adenine-specific) n=1 Tax=Streptomyces tsukubensis TaxID=83656 RepID=A0A1V4ADN0_9ACTN|nr:BREX-2 system adenine-specific DNA-methyltransferase PglX [Streptomyces tsukubensis]OON82075.1 SAM-dependent methyltransferase [Streptomyces tsukubensis]QFR92560.1 BREX-2 system adenine-specific DNA-methyltransferase PglX [Streptomyces tsukubensis]
MIARKALLADLKPQVAVVKKDLERQVDELFEVRERYTAEYEQARELGRTAATPKAWLDEQLTQVAVAWVLATVFVRFCEDNGLIAEPYLTAPDIDRRELAQARYDEYKSKADDPTWRGWLLKAFEEIGEGQAGQLLFNERHNPLYQVPLSHEGAGALVAFWGLRGEDGTLVHDFTDPLVEDVDGTQKGWGTRFLGDLYQDLSDDAQERYALLQTPEFVEKFILERTMTPALREFGFEGLKMIDPTCGSGHFVLGAFERLLKEWDAKATTADAHARVRAALDSVHGVDINPFAVAIARFRLLVAAMAAAGVHTMKKAAQYEWPVHLAVGDSLIKARQMELTLDGKEAEDPLGSFAYRTEDAHEHPEILRPGRYHVVVGNPPYITVKDKELNQRYREMYSACHKEYALTVPFAQRFFELSVNGDPETGRGYGMVGQITGNSFIKREFGVKLIEGYFGHRAELTEVIDTSGAFIPGHGTPTVILVGRRRGGRHRTSTVRTVRSVQGEPAVPDDPANGHVWSAIVDQIDKPGTVGKWVSVDDLDRERYFAKQPWVLADGGQELIDGLEVAGGSKLRKRAKRFGYTGQTNADSIMISSRSPWMRRGGEEDLGRTLVLGEELRDWLHSEGNYTFFPYKETQEKFELRPLAEDSGAYKWMWPGRTSLGHRATFSKGTYFSDGRPWYEWHQVTPSAGCHPWSISFAFVATHNHFVLDRDGKVFNRSAPVIKLREGASEEEYLQLLGVLNSSTAGLWLKMVSHDKGNRGGERSTGRYAWESFYEFTSTAIQDFPLPALYPAALATELDALAEKLAATTPAAVAATNTPTTPALREAHSHYTHLRTRLIALQEELDWQVYALYNLLDDDLRPAPRKGDDFADVPELALGQRAFEIVLARKVRAGEASDEWFRRHGSTQVTEIPAEWPATYREIVQKRIDAIEANRQIGMVERPEYKRRWATEGWDALQEKALRSWLLDRMEGHALWFDAEGSPQIRTLNQLVSDLEQDEDFVAVAELFAPTGEFAKTVAGLLANQHVPATAALRYKPSGLDKRKDWEHAWAEQRKEDAEQDFLAKKKIRDAIPVPRPYTSTDVLRGSYWSLRGKLDVPKERFISYGAENVQSPPLYGWAGWDHLQQAEALLGHLHIHGHELSDEEWPPLLAALLELQPWLDQWHNEIDPTYGSSPAADVLDGRRSLQGGRSLTDEDLKAWRPPVARRGRGTTTRTTKNATSTDTTTQKTEKES